MTAMGLVFGLLGGLIATAYSRHHYAISVHRDKLAAQLAVNERYRAALGRQSERLEDQNLLQGPWRRPF
jgi:hypothetical protein